MFLKFINFEKNNFNWQKDIYFIIYKDMSLLFIFVCIFLGLINNKEIYVCYQFLLINIYLFINLDVFVDNGIKYFFGKK